MTSALSNTKLMKISPFHYTDFRKFLADYFQSRRSAGPGLTYKNICSATGIKSPGNLSLILSGKANISDDLAKRLAGFCNLKKREASCFLTMVRFNQEKNNRIKLRLFEEIISCRESCIYRVGPHLYKFYARWYHSVIRALVEFIDVKDCKCDVLAKMVVPPVRPDQARASIKLLDELELIQKNEQGFWRPTQKSIDTGSAATSVMVNNFVLSMLERGREAMDRFPRDERVFSCVTLGIDIKGYEAIVTELREFRRKVAEIARTCTADKVVQVNFQVFPVSKKAGKEKGADG